MKNGITAWSITARGSIGGGHTAWPISQLAASNAARDKIAGTKMTGAGSGKCVERPAPARQAELSCRCERIFLRLPYFDLILLARLSVFEPAISGGVSCAVLPIRVFFGIVPSFSVT
jgi:hypothetical protein